MRTAVVTLVATGLVCGCDSPAVVGIAVDGPVIDSPVLSAPLDCANLSSSLAIKDSMEQPAAVFTVGEVITLSGHLTNSGTVAQTLHGSRCPWASVEIRDQSGQAVWEWGGDTANAPLMSCNASGTIGPGETTGESTGYLGVDWDQRRLLDGTQVPPGQYTAVFRDSTECASTLGKSATFEIQ